MTKRFRTEPYLRQAAAYVTAVVGDWVELDEPLLFAFSGGQQSDRGSIAGLEVLEAVEKDDGGIRYRLPEGHDLAVGRLVDQLVDWDVRHLVMRLHSATHLAYCALTEQLGARPLIGSNVHVSKGRLDWSLGEPIAPYLAKAHDRVAEVVARDLPIARYPEVDGSDNWLWEVRGDDLDPAVWRMPCGGTHVARTGEVGPVKLKRKNIGAGKERVEVTLAD